MWVACLLLSPLSPVFPPWVALHRSKAKLIHEARRLTEFLSIVVVYALPLPPPLPFPFTGRFFVTFFSSSSGWSSRSGCSTPSWASSCPSSRCSRHSSTRIGELSRPIPGGRVGNESSQHRRSVFGFVRRCFLSRVYVHSVVRFPLPFWDAAALSRTPTSVG